MPEIKIPKLFKTEIVKIETSEGIEKIEIKGYRGNDYTLLRLLSKKENQLMGMITKLNRITTDKEGNTKENHDYTDKEIEDLVKIKDQMDDIGGETEILIYKLAQRGLKRAFYPNIKKTEELDELPDIEVDDPTIKEVYNKMNLISTPKSKGTGSEKKENPSQSKKK